MTKILDQANRHNQFLSADKSGNDEYPISIPPGELFYSTRLTITDIHVPAAAVILNQPNRGDQGNQKITVAWDCKPNAMIEYQIEAFSCPPADLGPGATSRVTRQMTGFSPGNDGFHFDNYYDHPVPTVKVATPFGMWDFGDASRGLCGGMVYAALDFFNSKRPIPKDQTAPESGALFDFIVRRLINSFDIPTLGFMKYIELMNPDFPDYQSIKPSLFGPARPPSSRAWRMVRQEWPVIKKKLDAGHPWPLGLVEVQSKETSIGELSKNHQVLTYGYDLHDDQLTLYIYDPNLHDDDTLQMTLNVSNPEKSVNLQYSGASPVYCFFQTDYTFCMPPQI